MSLNLIEKANERNLSLYGSQLGLSSIDFQRLPFDQSGFATQTKSETRQLRSGVLFSQGSIELSDGSFTNFYDVSFDGGDPNFSQRIESRNTPYFLRRSLINDSEAIACINAGFLFLADETSHMPIDISYNLCIRDGKLIGLPAVDRPAVYVQNNKLLASEVKAKGVFSIDNQIVEWTGARSSLNTQAEDVTLFNSACCTISHDKSEHTGTQRVLDSSLNNTPRVDDGFDLVIRQDTDGVLRVCQINHNGQTDFFSGNFILQMKGRELGNIKIGSIVSPEMVDNLIVTELQSAISIGPHVHHFFNHDDHQVNHDASLGSQPPFAGKRKAHSIIYKEKNGSTHLQIFDGAPKTQNFQGVTPFEVTNIIRQEETEWAFHLDPGQSSKLAVRDEKSEISVYGNTHYVRWPKKPDMPFYWTPFNGRKIGSSISLLQNT